MGKKKTHEELLKNRREYRQNAGRFFLSFSAHEKDQEAREWLEAQPNRGSYLKALILADKEACLASENRGLQTQVFKRGYDVLWETQFDLLKKFKEKNGRWPKFQEKYEGYSLGRWYYKQKQQAYSANSSYQQRIDKLLSIGALERSWEQHYDLLTRFIDAFGRLPNPTEAFEDCKIGAWLERQKTDKHLQASPARFKKLRALGVFQTNWDSNYDLLVKFKEMHGRLPKYAEVYEGVALGRWLNYQIKTHPDSLSSEHHEKLDALGAFEDPFERRYTLLLKFIEINGRLPKNDEQFEGVKLGSWLSRQKKSKNLTNYPDRIKKLKKIGVQLILEDKQTE